MNEIKTLSCIILLLFGVKANGQYNNNHWAFGDSAYINWSNPNNPTVGVSAHTYRNGSACISDSNGILLYTGYNYNLNPLRPSIWNKFDIDITDTGRIYGGLWYHSSLFIPDPGNDSIIYLFTIGVTSASRYGFYYSRINFKANNDSGEVIQKNVQLNNFPAFDGLMAVRHGNGRDWWVVSQRWFAPSGQVASNEFTLYLISPVGISGPFLQNIGSMHSTNLGHLVFSSGGNQFVNVSIRGLIELYNFDRCTGLITSTIPIEQEPSSSPYPNTHLNCAFSPNNERLYVMSFSQISLAYYIYQFDLTAPDIAASKTVIDSFSNAEGMGEMRLATDGKIYVACFDLTYSWPYPDTSTAYTTINNNLSVINFPDSLGIACDFQPFSFNLGTGRSYFGLPNNPDYELGAWVGSPCDTLTVGLTENEKDDVFFQAWYNPEWNMIHVNASKLKGKSGVLRLFDVEGRVVVERKVEVIAGGYFTGEIGMNGIASGVYIVSLTTERDKVQSKVLRF